MSAAPGRPKQARTAAREGEGTPVSAVEADANARRWDGPQGPIHYQSAGAGQTLLLLHGSLCDYRYWRWQYPELGRHFHVVAPSLSGYWPGSDAASLSAYGLARHVDDAAVLAQALGGGRPCHVLGHSRGAHVALELALRHPEHVASLTLADPGFRYAHEPYRPSFHLEAAGLAEAGRHEEALALFIDHVNGSDTWRRMSPWFKQMARDNAVTLPAQAREHPAAVDLDALPARLRCPLLLITGALSPERYQSRAQALAEHLPGAGQASIPLAAHGMNLAHPRAFNRVVLGFLQGQQP